MISLVESAISLLMDPDALGVPNVVVSVYVLPSVLTSGVEPHEVFAVHEIVAGVALKE